MRVLFTYNGAFSIGRCAAARARDARARTGTARPTAIASAGPSRHLPLTLSLLLSPLPLLRHGPGVSRARVKGPGCKAYRYRVRRAQQASPLDSQPADQPTTATASRARGVTGPGCKVYRYRVRRAQQVTLMSMAHSTKAKTPLLLLQENCPS